MMGADFIVVNAMVEGDDNGWLQSTPFLTFCIFLSLTYGCASPMVKAVLPNPVPCACLSVWIPVCVDAFTHDAVQPGGHWLLSGILLFHFLDRLVALSCVVSFQDRRCLL